MATFYIPKQPTEFEKQASEWLEKNAPFRTIEEIEKEDRDTASQPEMSQRQSLPPDSPHPPAQRPNPPANTPRR